MKGFGFRRAVSVSPVRDWLYRHLWPWSRIESERNAAYVRGYWDGITATGHPLPGQTLVDNPAHFTREPREA